MPSARRALPVSRLLNHTYYGWISRPSRGHTPVAQRESARHRAGPTLSWYMHGGDVCMASRGSVGMCCGVRIRDNIIITIIFIIIIMSLSAARLCPSTVQNVTGPYGTGLERSVRLPDGRPLSTPLSLR